MKKHFWRKSVAFALSGVLAASSLPMLANMEVGAMAVPNGLPISNEFYYQNESLQPYGACFQVSELKNWSPDMDPDARYNKSGYDKKDRWMGPNVNPNASRDAKVYPLAMSNPRASEGKSQGGDGDFVYAFTNFQYVDTYNFWGGSGTEGPIAIPSPEHIDSAHKNGVPATATIFIPWGDSQYGNEFIRQLVEQDAEGNFIIADKLIEIAQYYGFDGYMINHESGSNALFDDFLAYIQKKKPDGFTMTWYNGSGSLSAGSIGSWMQNGDTRVNDEWWLDMSWGGIDGTLAAAKNAGRSPFDIHASWEYFPYEGKGGRIDSLIGADKKLKCSLGILSPTVTLTNSKDSSDFQNVQDQKLWVGPTFDPRSTERGNVWPGFSNLIADQTPIIGSEFVTNFTTGNGYNFYEDGEITGKTAGWYNRSMTDVMPTWRWIIDSEGQKLAASIDYEDAYYAGTSLKYEGNLDAGKANHVKLYSAQLEIKDDSKLSVTYKTPDSKGVQMSMGLCFGDTYDDANFKFYDVETSVNGEWTTATIDLKEDAGKTAIAISMKFASEADVTDYSMNIGRLAVTTDSANAVTPATVTGATYDEVIYPNDTSAQARIYWDKAENADIYRIHRVHPDGSREFIGATPNNAFFINEFTKDGDESSFNFEIVPVSANGTEGNATIMKFNWPQATGGFEEVLEEGENIALGAPAVSNYNCEGDGPVDKINDGVITLSKWCVSRSASTYSPIEATIDLGENKDISRWVVYHANCRGAGEGVDFNTADFSLKYAADDGLPLLDGDTSASRSRVANMNFTTADTVVDNYADVTDRNLSEPITARYIKLSITRSDRCPWSAARIYEFELYENTYTTAPDPVLARNVNVKNNPGATDTVVVNNVPMENSSAETGIVRLYDSLDAETPFATMRANQPGYQYTEHSKGIATFENLDLPAEGGRLYYATTDAEKAKESPRYSVVIPPENGEAIPTPEATLTSSNLGKQLKSAYGVLTLSGLPEGTSLKVYDSADSMVPILFGSEIQEGGDSIRMERIPLNKNGGTIYYELSREGQPDSERYALDYDAPSTLPADAVSIDTLVERYGEYKAEEYIASTWTAFETAYNAAKALQDADDVTGAQVEEARTNLAEAAANLKLIPNLQRAEEYYNELDEQIYYDEAFTDEEWTAIETAMNNYKAMIDSTKDLSDPKTKLDLEKGRIALDAALEKAARPGSIKIDALDKLVPGANVNMAQVAYKVIGVGGLPVGQDVSWSVSGGTSAQTRIEKSWSSTNLYIGSDETARTITLTATSTDDYSVSGSVDIAIKQYGEIVLPNVKGGTVTADKTTAQDDETVTVTVTPDEGYRMKAGSLTMNGEPIVDNTFVMPAGNAVIDVEFEKKPVMSILETMIAEAERLKAEGALEGTVDAVVEEFNAALEAAKALDAETASQSEVNAATDRLLKAIGKVDWKKGDITKLEIAVEIAKSIDENLDLYVEAGKQEFIDALAAAKKILANSGNTLQDEIDVAADRLVDAMIALRMAPNKDILNDMIQNADKMDLSGYTADSVKVFNAALANAKAVLTDDNATQNDVDAAAAELAAAKLGLVKGNASVDNTAKPDVDAPVQDAGEGKAPATTTKTGDAGSLAVFGVMAMAAAAVVLLKKREH